ncbi:hypothetical protein AB6A40_006520 [Gnathostoma spinigerum]|uniref:G-protein coupled receptors family 1 profile domain-containing protein n=1 Tax=Gnathostoma spinigerum TaxID=75299 RepID=A0ABD6EQU9_9BILA
MISSYCLCFIAMDRYRNIVTITKEPWTVRHALLITVVSWFLSIFISSPLFMAQRLQPLVFKNITLCGYFCGEYNWPDDARVKLTYGSILLICQYIIPATIMAFCYFRILKKVQTDWLVTEGPMLTEAQQAQTSVRKKRVMYVLILMVVAFMASWLPLTVVNISRDFGIGNFLETQMYFKLLNVHAIAMTSIIWNPLLYFWMSKSHRRALKKDIFWLTSARRQPTQIGILSRFTPSAQVNLIYQRALENQLSPRFRRGTLADPTCASQERALAEMHAGCFLLVPLMPLCRTSTTVEAEGASKKQRILTR